MSYYCNIFQVSKQFRSEAELCFLYHAVFHTRANYGVVSYHETDRMIDLNHIVISELDSETVYSCVAGRELKKIDDTILRLLGLLRYCDERVDRNGISKVLTTTGLSMLPP